VSGVTAEEFGLNMAAPGEFIPPRLVKFPPTIIPLVVPSSMTNEHMARIVASDDASVAKPPLGNCDKTDWLSFVLYPFSLCPWNWYSDMPSKSPASPTRPRLERSILEDCTGLKVIAFEKDATDVIRRPRRSKGGGSQYDGLSHEEGFIAEFKE
jgi:hypothetical protein